MSINILRDSNVGMVDLLANFLPKIVWIGPSKSALQPAYLIRENDYLEYTMSNEPMQSVNNPESYFPEWKDFEDWIENILKESQKIEGAKKTLDDIKSKKEQFNKYFDFEVLKIYNTNFNENIILFHSVKRILEQLLIEMNAQIENEKTELQSFLVNNRFSITDINDISIESIDNLLDAYHQFYEEEYKVEMENLYDNCTIDVEVIDFHSFAEIYAVPPCIAIIFMQEKREEVKKKKEEQRIQKEILDNRQKMRKVWLEKFEK